MLITGAAPIAILAGMRAASAIIGPVVIALVITIAWSPASEWLRKRGWRPTFAALTGILFAVAIIALLVALVWTSLIQLQDKLPEYQPRIAALQAVIQQKLADLPFDTTRLFSSDVLKPASIVGYAVKLIRSLTQTAGNLVLLVLLMAFMMLEAIRYPDKLRHAFHSSPEVVERFNRFGDKIRSYVSLNALFGLIAAVINTMILLALGVDFAVLWGVLSFLLSFVPNVGFLISLTPPALLALVEHGFGRAIAVVVAYVVVNSITDNIIKPRFVGATLDLSPIVVVISLLFWAWLLGPMGALVAVPLSLAVKFLFESFDESKWLAILMSDAAK
jgi:predicted PurR-regulated permease PerM